jgi:hypothetical protein
MSNIVMPVSDEKFGFFKWSAHFLGYISDIKLSRLSFIATSLPPAPPKKNFTGFTFNPKKVDI